MKAVVRRERELVITDVPEPVPQSGQVLVKTLGCGICGSDLHALLHAERRVRIAAEAGVPSSMDPAGDIVFGHEFCAEILEFGPDTARRLAVGTRVVCLPYARGPGGWELVGYSNRFPGGFGERMVVTEDLLIPVPDTVSSIAATMTEPLAVGIHAVNEARVSAQDPCMVIGCGPVGLAVIATLRGRGVQNIIGVDFSPARREVARQVGATSVIDPAADNPHRYWGDWGVEMRKPDPTIERSASHRGNRAQIFECVGVPGVLQNIFRGAPPFSNVIVVGLCMEPDEIEPCVAFLKEISLQFVASYSPGEFAESLAGIADGRFDVGPFLTGAVGLSAVPHAFDVLTDPSAKHVKIVVDPGQTSPGIIRV